jgi:hypothetical protein
MKTKKSMFIKIGVLLILFSFFLGCASVKYSETIPEDKMPGAGESLITVQRAMSGYGMIINMQIWINDEEVVSGIKNGARSFIVVPNGTYTVQTGSNKIDRGNAITLTVNDEEVICLAQPAMGLLTARFNLKETGRRKLGSL